MRFIGKNVYITGGESGIGRAVVEALLAEGARVHVAGLDPAGLAAVDALSPLASTSHTDVTDRDAVANSVAGFAEDAGGLHVVVANAGIGGRPAPLHEYEPEVFESVIATHVLGTFHVLRAAVPLLGAGGSIVVTSSTAGLTGYPEMSAYVAAKHAQVGLVRSVARELAPRGIRINSVNPGPTGTRLQDDYARAALGVDARDGERRISEGIPLGRYNTPGEVAAAVLFLASHDAATVTGTSLVIDGGALA